MATTNQHKVIPPQVLQHFMPPQPRVVLTRRTTEAAARAHAPLLAMQHKPLCKAFLAWQYAQSPECRDARESAKKTTNRR